MYVDEGDVGVGREVEEDGATEAVQGDTAESAEQKTPKKSQTPAK